jgi:hypothetical protein
MPTGLPTATTSVSKLPGFTGKVEEIEKKSLFLAHPFRFISHCIMGWEKMSSTIIRASAEKNLRRMQRKGEFIRIFYDYSCAFADNLKMPKKNVHRYTQINTDEENYGVKICVYLWQSVDKFLMRLILAGLRLAGRR